MLPALSPRQRGLFCSRNETLRIQTEKTGEVGILQCTGRLAREARDLLKQTVTGLSYLRVLVLDLSEVDRIDAGGVGVLVFSPERKFCRAALSGADVFACFSCHFPSAIT